MEERIRLFYAAAENQTDVMIKNILGQGIDIHLLGLRQLARHSGCPEATAVFEDSSYRIINHFALSTSQVRIYTTTTSILSLSVESFFKTNTRSILSIFTLGSCCRRRPVCVYADPDQLGLVYGLRTSRPRRLRMFLQPST